MAVPGFERKTRLCERCFANVPADLATCPECGAALSTDRAVEGSDAAIYPELSRANLLRMRGDYQAAKDQCLAILKRYPNNASVHTLLGDIFAEQDDLEQAAQWYELAIDLNPDSDADKTKLATVRERERRKETQSSSEILGIPPNRPNVPLFAILSVGGIILVGVLAYFLGQGVQRGTASREIVAPVEAPNQIPDTTPTSQEPLVQNLRRDPQEDRELASLVSQRSTASANLVSVLIDPRRNIVTVTYNVGQDHEAKRIGAELARTVLDQSAATLIVTLRAVRQDRIVYMADVPRTRYSELQAGGFDANEAWIDQLVTNEWFANPPPAAPGPPVTAPPTNVEPPTDEAPLRLEGTTAG